MGAFANWWTSPPPSVALEVTASSVNALSLRRSGSPTVAMFASEPLPPGSVVPAVTSENVVDRSAASQAVASVLRRVGNPKRVALVLPDSAAKVSIVSFDKVPSRTQDLDQLIRWQVRKAVPFPIDTAQVGYSESGSSHGSGHRFVVVVMRRDIVESYEALLNEIGVLPGLVDLASFNVVNMVSMADHREGRQIDGDWLLLHLTKDASTLTIVREGSLVFYRHRDTSGQEPLIDLVHQTAMYYEDRLGGRGFARVVLSATAEALSDESHDLSHTLSERLKSPVEPIDPEKVARLDDSVLVAYDELVSMAAPLGILLREAA